MGWIDRIKSGFSTAKSAVYSVSNLDFEEMKGFFNFGSSKKGTREYLNSFKKNPLVYMVVNKVSQTTAAMPRIVEDEKGDEILKSDLKALIENPNPSQSQIEFNEEVNESLLLTGDAFILYHDDPELIALPATLKVLKPDKIQPKFNKGVILFYEYTDEFGTIVTYSFDDILHIKTSNIVTDERTGFKTGLSPLEAGWIIVESSDQKFEAEASIFQNRGIIGIVTSKGDTPMLDDERKEMQEQFDSEVGGASRFNKIKVSSTELNYLQTGMSPTDLKLIEGIISSLRLICGLYGMPSVLFNDTANSSFNNYTTAVAVSYSDVYVPLARKIDNKLSSFLSAKLKTNEFIRVDSSKVDGIKASTNEVAQSLSDLPQLLATAIVGDMSRNERRDVVGLPPKEGGDEITPTIQPNTSINV